MIEKQFTRDESNRAAHQETQHFKADIAAMLPHVDRRERIPLVPDMPTA